MFLGADTPSADAYFMRHIIHDWDDEKSTTILKNCRKAMGDKGKLLVVEGVVPPGNEPSVSKFLRLGDDGAAWRHGAHREGVPAVVPGCRVSAE